MFRNIILMYCLSLLYTSVSSQEYRNITKDEAIIIALKQDPKAVLADLYINQSQILSNSKVPLPPTQIFFSGDEFNLEGVSGVQSLNVQQAFNLPKVSRSYQGYKSAQSKVLAYQKGMTEKEIISNVESAFYKLAVAKQDLLLREEAIDIYNAFLTRSQDAFQGGESNKFPLIAAENLVKKALLNIDHAQHEMEVARELFNIWLGNSDAYDVNVIDLIPTDNPVRLENIENPHIGIYELEKEVVNQSIELQKSKLLPQLNTGAKLQSINGDLLYFGYQLGVNIPLAKSNYNKQISASKINLDILDTEKRIKMREIDLKVTAISNHLDHLRDKINTYDSELLPSSKAQLTLLNDAYKVGEGSYLEYMLSIESYNELQLEKLALIEDYYKNYVELKYWTEVN